MAATDRSRRRHTWPQRWQRLRLRQRLRERGAAVPARPLRRHAALATGALGVAGGLWLAGPAAAATLPEDKAELMYHMYDGGGVRATGPALLVRKSLADQVSLSASYYVDAVSNASIDVVTTASPFDEKRDEYGFGADYVYRDTLMSVSVSHSREPDYVAKGISIDVAQDVFGGMTTVNLGFTRAADDVGRSDTGFFDRARHWRYRLGATQILTPAWLASANLEVVSDSGYLGNPYRVARVFGAAVPERSPRTRTSRALKFRVVGAPWAGSSVHGEYRYFWDTWDIKAHTVQFGYSRYFGEKWLADGYVRYHTQSKALFYSDNAMQETTYISRNRQLSSFDSASLGLKLSYRFMHQPGRYDLKAHAAYEFKRFDYSDFTDIRTGRKYSHDANILQFYLSATY
ncbi:DUF3570 domain-containing protein [Caldimonas thermodepolymerans]|uniref:DUF3570 domain-containing protein n=1 Tax=Caldimonas thermodepolymerans TaxID=215580 RepID=UPI0024914527|nr:DUF3570 domain-containing protein [Caldimonas thermodepolymerans]